MHVHRYIADIIFITASIQHIAL